MGNGCLIGCKAAFKYQHALASNKNQRPRVEVKEEEGGEGRAERRGKEECWWVKILFPLLFARFELKFVGVSISGERYVASDIARERERNIY